jgi:hypothetical protein
MRRYVTSLLLILMASVCLSVLGPSGHSASINVTKFPWADVTTFGAIAGDGLDDSAAFQAAIDSLGAVGGTVMIPCGTYNLSSSVQIKEAVHIRGCGRGIQSTPPVRVILAAGVNGFVVGDHIGQWSISDMGITNGAIGIQVRGESAGFRLSNLRISAQTSDAIRTDSVEDFTFDHVSIESCAGHGWRGGFRDIATGRTERATIINLRLTLPGQNAVYLADSGGSSPVIGLVFDQLTVIESGQHGLAIEGAQNITIIGMVVENAGISADNTYDGVNLTVRSPAQISIISSFFHISNIHANGQRYGVNSSASNSVILASTGQGRTNGFNSTVGTNIIASNGTLASPDPTTSMLFGTTFVGQALTPDSGVRTSYPSMKGADLVSFLLDSNANATGTLGNWEWRIADSNRTRRALMSNDGAFRPRRSGTLNGTQTFADGDTTPTVAAGNVFKTANTGATTITNFDDGVANQQIVVICNDSNTTLSDSGSLSLAGALTCAANKTITLVLDGSTWRELARSTN